MGWDLGFGMGWDWDLGRIWDWDGIMANGMGFWDLGWDLGWDGRWDSPNPINMGDKYSNHDLIFDGGNWNGSKNSYSD